MILTPAQFAALGRLVGWHRDSPVAAACALVLIDGKSQAEAARLAGTTRQAVNRALARVAEVREAAAALSSTA